MLTWRASETLLRRYKRSVSNPQRVEFPRHTRLRNILEGHIGIAFEEHLESQRCGC
jgi:hypothetical protein